MTVLRERAWLALREKIDKQTEEPILLVKLHNHFNKRFRYDEQGILRVWRSGDHIDGLFKNAKDQVGVL